jgi:hypothetical protein
MDDREREGPPRPSLRLLPLASDPTDRRKGKKTRRRREAEPATEDAKNGDDEDRGTDR